MKTVDKAYAYITWRQRLLVFEQPHFPEAGVQVPGGSVKPGEAPVDAALREAHEETGLDNLEARAFLGRVNYPMKAHGKPEIHRRYFYHLLFVGNAPERWQHYERDRSDGEVEPVLFELYWVNFSSSVPELIAGHGAFLDQLEL